MRRGVAALGLCSWDRFIVTDYYPGPGEYAIVQHQFQQAGGTTANTCAALAKLEVPVLFASTVGDDDEGRLLVASLANAGCDTRHIVSRPNTPTDSGIIVVSGAVGNRDRTIFWIQGAKPEIGDYLPVHELLDHEWLLLDVSDHRLRSFVLDLPAHLSPRTKLVGAMTYLSDLPRDLAWDHALRHDVLFGNERELRQLTGAATTDDAIAIARHDMVGRACRVIFLTAGRNGARALRVGGIVEQPAYAVEVRDTTGAGDAFVAGAIWALLERLDDVDVLKRGNATAALTCRELGARAAQPERAAVLELIASGRTVPA